MSDKKRGFIRVLWGTQKEGDDFSRNKREIVNDDVEVLSRNKFDSLLNPITFIFGRDNYRYMIDQGFTSCVMLDKNPWPKIYENQHFFAPKFAAYQAATDYFDEFVFLDIDCMPVKPLPDNFWEEHAKKEAIQGSLMLYMVRVAGWRDRDKRKVPCGCYVYIRDKKIPSALIQLGKDYPNAHNDEDLMARYIDDNIANNWQGLDYYLNQNFLCSVVQLKDLYLRIVKTPIKCVLNIWMVK